MANNCFYSLKLFSSKFILAVLFGTVFLSTPLTPSLNAGDVIYQKGINRVLVKRIKRPEKWYKLRRGSTLNTGDIVRTGRFSKAELIMSDGSKIVLGSKSRLTIQVVEEDSVFELARGWMKAFVKKLKPRSKFQVKTPLAAASVRGTVFEMSFDHKANQGSLDVSEGTVALLKDGREVLLNAGQKIEFLPDVPLGDPVGAPRKARSGTTDRATVRREVGLGLSKEQVMLAAAEEMRLAEYQVGKVLTDVHGNRVRLEEYIIRGPREVASAQRDQAFKLVVLNERDNRFDYFYYRGIFNTTLPDDLSLALNNVRGTLGTTAPTYYLTDYEMGMSNTQDFIRDNGSGGHLVEIRYDGTEFTLLDPDNPTTNTRTITEDEQSVIDGITYHKIYDPVNDRFINLSDTQFQAGDFRPVIYDASNDTFRVITSGDVYWRTAFNSYTHVINNISKQSYAVSSTVPNVLALDFDADFTFGGGALISFTESPSGADLLHNRISLFYGDGTRETYDTYIISDDGEIGNLNSFSNLTTGQAFKDELLKWNYQQVITASEFNGRKIDLVVEPKILIKSGLIQ